MFLLAFSKGGLKDLPTPRICARRYAPRSARARVGDKKKKSHSAACDHPCLPWKTAEIAPHARACAPRPVHALPEPALAPARVLWRSERAPPSHCTRRPGERGRAAPRAGSLRSRRGSRLFPLRLLLVRGGEREVAALAVDALGGQRAVKAGRDLVPVLALDGDLRVDRAVAIDDEYVRVVAPVIGRRRREAAVVPVVVEMGRAWRIRSEWAPSLLGRSNRRTASTW